MQHASSQNFRYIEITEFDLSLTREEDVGAFEVAMTDLGIVQSFEAHDHLGNNRDYLVTGK